MDLLSKGKKQQTTHKNTHTKKIKKTEIRKNYKRNWKEFAVNQCVK